MISSPVQILKKFHGRKRKIFAFIFGHFYAFDVKRFPDYQLISRQIIRNELVRGHKSIGSHLNQTNPTNSQQFLIRFSLQGRRFAGSRRTGGAEIHQIWQNTKIDLEDVCARKGNEWKYTFYIHCTTSPPSPLSLPPHTYIHTSCCAKNM